MNRFIFILSFMLLPSFLFASQYEQLVKSGDRPEVERVAKKLTSVGVRDLLPSFNTEGLAAKFLTTDDLVSILEVDLSSLQATQKKINDGQHLDERFRWLIWNAGTTLSLLDKKDDGSNSERITSAHIIIDKAYQYYQKLCEEMQNTVESLNINDPKMSKVVSMVQTDGAIPRLAEELEVDFELDDYNKNHEACGMTARAVIDLLLKDKEQRRYPKSLEGVDNLIKEIQYVDESNQAVYLIESDRIDHAFVILKLDIDRYVVLQSFVGKYSLKGYLTQQMKEFGSIEKNRSEIVAFLDALNRIDEAKGWSPILSQLHEKLFLVDAPDYIKNEFSCYLPDVSFKKITF